MTPDAMVTLIKARMANSNDASLDSLIIDIAKVVQERLEREPQLPWFLFGDTNVDGTNMSTSASAETVALPSDFIREDAEQEYTLFRYDSALADPWVGLVRDNYSIIKTKRQGEGEPEYYDIMGSKIYFRYIPDDTYTIRLLYLKSDDAIAAGDTENLWMQYASDWIMAETGLMLASDVVIMPTVAQSFREDAQRAQNRIKRDTIARTEAGMMRMMGDE